MRRDDIDNQLKDASFEFFYWFSRFEFALKENKCLKSQKPGANAEPNWKKFQSDHKTEYVASTEARELIGLHPKRQYVAEHGELEWKPVGISHCNNDLCKVVAMLCTIRNNLFHGGKHGDTDLDSKERNLKLLAGGKVVLDQLAELAGFTSDYKRYY